jgi:hypothetical protein
MSSWVGPPGHGRFPASLPLELPLLPPLLLLASLDPLELPLDELAVPLLPPEPPLEDPLPPPLLELPKPPLEDPLLPPESSPEPESLPAAEPPPPAHPLCTAQGRVTTATIHIPRAILMESAPRPAW